MCIGYGGHHKQNSQILELSWMTGPCAMWPSQHHSLDVGFNYENKPAPREVGTYHKDKIKTSIQGDNKFKMLMHDKEWCLHDSGEQTRNHSVDVVLD